MASWLGKLTTTIRITARFVHKSIPTVYKGTPPLAVSEISAVNLANEYPWGQGTNYLQYVMYFNSKIRLVYLNVTTWWDESGHRLLVKIC